MELNPKFCWKEKSFAGEILLLEKVFVAGEKVFLEKVLEKVFGENFSRGGVVFLHGGFFGYLGGVVFQGARLFKVPAGGVVIWEFKRGCIKTRVGVTSGCANKYPKKPWKPGGAR